MKITPSLDIRANAKFDFLHEDEKCHMFFRRHGMCLLFTLGKNWIPFVFLFSVFSVVFIWSLRTNGIETSLSRGTFVIVALFGIVLLHWLFLEVITYLLGFMMVTDRRIIEVHKIVFLREEMNEIPFDHVTNIHHEKNGILQNILRYGTLRIDSNIGRPIKMHFIPCSEDKFAKISGIYGGMIVNRISKSSKRKPKISPSESSKSKTEEIRKSLRSYFHKTISRKRKEL